MLFGRPQKWTPLGCHFLGLPESWISIMGGIGSIVAAVSMDGVHELAMAHFSNLLCRCPTTVCFTNGPTVQMLLCFCWRYRSQSAVVPSAKILGLVTSGDENGSSLVAQLVLVRRILLPGFENGLDSDKGDLIGDGEPNVEGEGDAFGFHGLSAMMSASDTVPSNVSAAIFQAVNSELAERHRGLLEHTPPPSRPPPLLDSRHTLRNSREIQDSRRAGDKERSSLTTPRSPLVGLRNRAKS
eukprot:gene16415-biopygen4619